MSFQHATVADGRWQKLSLVEQLGNIGSEVGRARKWQGMDEKLFEGAATRALELFDLTLADPRWIHGKQLREIARAREVFCDALFGGTAYESSLEDLDRYLSYFAFAARNKM